MGSYMNEKFLTTDSMVVLPTEDSEGNELIRTGTYYFTLSLENVFGKPAQITKSVTVIEPKNVPTVSITGNSVVNTYRNKELSLFASASVLVCGVPMDSGLEYTWTVYKDGLQLIPIESSSKDVRQFR